MIRDRFPHYDESDNYCTVKRREARKIPWDGYCKKERSRNLPKGDRYSLWRCYEDGAEMWGCVIWYGDWYEKWLADWYRNSYSKKRKGSSVRGSAEETGSYLREKVEWWAEYTLKRIQHTPEIIDLLHEDFKALTEDPDFRL